MSIQEQKITEAAIAANGVQSRPDKLTGTAAQNKKVFDALVTAVVREKFNALLDELTGTAAAAQLGITTIPGFSAGDIQTALEQIVQAMQDVTQGSVTDGSITLAKLAAEVTAVALGGAAASHTHGAGDINSGVLDAARIPVLDGTKLGAGSIGTAQLGAAAVTTDKLAALSVLAVIEGFLRFRPERRDRREARERHSVYEVRPCRRSGAARLRRNDGAGRRARQ